jgi:hypothetical protein
MSWSSWIMMATLTATYGSCQAVLDTNVPQAN